MTVFSVEGAQPVEMMPPQALAPAVGAVPYVAELEPGGAKSVMGARDGVDVSGFVSANERPLLLTKDQAAAVLTISVRQMERLVAAGDLVPTRIGGLVRFAPREPHAFVERSTVSRVAWPAVRGAVRARR